MSRDTYLVEKGGRSKDVWSLDNLCTNHWLSGHAPGAETAAAFLLDKSTALFVKGETAKAELLRDAAKELISVLIPKLKARAEREEKEHPDLVKTGDG